jgi:adenosylcobinamide-phosphate synthase
MPPLSLILAFILDLVLGDPRRLPHPVRLIGFAVSRLEKLLLAPGLASGLQVYLGFLLVLVVTCFTFTISHLLIWASFSYLGNTAGFAVTVYLAYTTISVKGLADAAREVMDPLKGGDLEAARRGLSMVVGRDTAGLDAGEVARGAVETVAENTSDGIVAPLFYLALGGPPLALLYKSINTMDSMIGYKNERYLYFGRAAARLDDIANFVPARLTAALMVAASYLSSGYKTVFSWEGSWRIMKRDHAKHTSINSGYPEAAAAGALGVRLGGPSTYRGVKSVKPYIGDPVEPLLPAKIEAAIRLMYVTAFLALALSAVIAYIMEAS